MFGHTYNNVYLCSVKTLNRKMKRYRYIKSNAFTTGASLGNPAACVFMGEETLSPEQMQAVAREHKGFVMEVVFCSQSDVADCKLTYYSSECEVDFCGHGTIATMYSMIKDNPVLRSKSVVKVETNRKGIVEVFNAIDTEDAVYITAPDPIEHSVNLTVEAIGEALGLKHGAIRQDLPIRIIDAGLRTLIVPITDLETEISVFPDEQELKIFCEGNDIDIILIFSKQTADTDAFAHTRVFAPKFGYLEDPATGSGNSAFANYLLSENLWNGAPITIEQGGNDRIFNSVKVKYSDGQVLFGGKSTIRIEGDYLI
jgi:PhzF family phenazine biosynthesis protein